MTSNAPPISVSEMQSFVHRELSTVKRLPYVLLLLVSAAMSVMVMLLLVTETQLPARTQVAFAALTAIGLGWSAFSVWVLSRRRPLYARHRVVAGRLAVAFCVVFTVGALAVSLVDGKAMLGLLAALCGASLLVLAWTIMRQAEAHRQSLIYLKSALEQSLGSN